MANCWFPIWYIILLGMWRLSIKIDCMRSIEISWNFHSRQVERKTMWFHFPIFKANPKVRTLSGRKDPMLTGSLASSSSSSILLQSRGLQQEDYVQGQQEDYIKTKPANIMVSIWSSYSWSYSSFQPFLWRYDIDISFRTFDPFGSLSWTRSF